MFYEGSLQEGISAAVGQQKMVLCFVTNEYDESNIWESDFLQDPSLVAVIAKQAVALRLRAGSEEAGYLAQIFPLPQTPTIVIMKHGELKEYVAAGTTKDEFLRRIRNSFNVSPPHTAQPASDALSSSPPASPHSGGTLPTVEQSENVRRVLEERAAKLEAAKAAAEQKAKEDLARRRAKAAAEASEGAQKQAELARKKKQQEVEDRRRILKRIQDDKEERRQRAAEREQQRMEIHSRSDSSLPVGTASPLRAPTVARNSNLTSIQVRLFDGSTVRSRFKTSDPVKEIRKWVDENRTDGRLPYTFTQLLTPLPNRSIDETEEEKSLGDMGLSPSSTLILIHVQSYSSAYDGSSQGVLSWILGSILAFLARLLGLIGLGGGGGRNSHDMAPQESDVASAHAKSRRVRGFENPDDQRRDHQLYNGNSLNFEPRPDEDE
ncbi:UBX domain-containing protein [Metarhizium album ARSEF 1941]|uniref:UBX domain-containing protein 2 n=1 Tax=Metarhizium album (strain ARSEF 1941) TaxID=1081103 RepID=A0A0B2X0T3_METAS|nr:UBX domain-containing protein [Metarhizium album ARSEF 1941]KHN98690.1 UBX domain-containing protein [Metarhizium album ARSEF 1941]